MVKKTLIKKTKKAMKSALSLWFSVLIYFLCAWLLLAKYNLLTFIFYTATVLLAFKNMKILIAKPHIPGMIAIGFVLTNYAVQRFINDTLPHLNSFTISSITSTVITILLFAPIYYLGHRLRKTYKKGKVLK